MDTVDHTTGEIVGRLPAMPKEIAEAVFQVKSGITQLGFDERNEHSKYSYASIDKFYAALRPLEADAGLEILLDETGFDVHAGDSGKGWVFINYDVWLLHRSGVMWGPLRRHMALPVTGAQTFGSAESYIHKAFRRGFYMVPTGEKDGDEGAPRDDVPVARASRMTPAVAPQSSSRDVANAIYSRIRSEIKAARSIKDLNRTGINSLSADKDHKTICAQDGGDNVWDALVALHEAKRKELVPLPDDPIPDLAPDQEYRI